MKFLTKLTRFFAWILVIYFLLFVAIGYGTTIYWEFVPTSSEFDGLLLVFLFYPFFLLIDFAGFWLSIFVSSVLFLLLTLVVLEIKPRKVILGTIGIISFLLLVYSVNSMEYVDSLKPITTYEEAFLLGKEAALSGDYGLCAAKKSSESLMEGCLKIAAIYSGDRSFCDEEKGIGNDCYKDTGTANNFVDLRCEDNLSRAECLDKYCFLPGNSYEYSWYINSCFEKGL